MTKNNDIDKYKYSGYGLRFNRKAEFSVGNGFGRNCIIFGVDVNSSLHVDNKKKAILILGKCPTQGLDGTTLTAQKKYSINFTENNKKFCMHYGTKIFKFKAKDPQNCSNSIMSRKHFKRLFSR